MSGEVPGVPAPGASTHDRSDGRRYSFFAALSGFTSTSFAVIV